MRKTLIAITLSIIIFSGLGFYITKNLDRTI